MHRASCVTRIACSLHVCALHARPCRVVRVCMCDPCGIHAHHARITFALHVRITRAFYMQNACSTHAFYVHHAYIARDTLHVRWACTTRALHVHGTRGTVSHKSLAVHVQYNDTCPCMACMLLCMVTCALHAHCLSSARIARAAFGALSNYAHCIPRLLCLTSPCACSGSPFIALHVHDPDPTHTLAVLAHYTHTLHTH